ncbi:helix-turn-helix domain-containing protein [Seonamhaeicola sp. MEBiC1930]|uniref:helix-turn-helix domain-containing protein n=1 Tax=Seonamhaeicola sp. MEBiC01930 TaxID=2976768 RepID=UPI00324E66A7
MQVVCLQEEAFYKLFDKVVEHLEQKRGKEAPFKWIDGDEAMKLLNISSKTTLQKLRDEGKVRFSQPQKRIILYDRNSIDEYLELHARETF